MLFHTTSWKIVCDNVFVASWLMDQGHTCVFHQDKTSMDLATMTKEGAYFIDFSLGHNRIASYHISRSKMGTDGVMWRETVFAWTSRMEVTQVWFWYCTLSDWTKAPPILLPDDEALPVALYSDEMVREKR